MSAALVDHCLELLAPLGSVRARRMFGGHGLYCDDLFFALIAADRLYLLVDAQSQPAFAAAARRPPGEQGNLGRPGVSLAQGKPMTMG